MVDSEVKQSPMAQRQSNPVESGQNMENLFSPRFKSLAAMAGWDEESILVASLIVEDTPDREFKHKRRSDLNIKTPSSNSSRRKRRSQRKSPISISVPPINLDEEKLERQENQKEKSEPKIEVEQESKRDEVESSKQDSGVSSSKSVVPCMDKLKEELSCAICLEICFEPSTTSCGHSFCKKCLRSAADKCGKKCPKCRQLISNGRSCTVNTVLWNTIQLLFPEEVEARKAAGASNTREEVPRVPSGKYLRPATLEDLGLEEDLWPVPDARRGTSRDGASNTRAEDLRAPSLVPIERRQSRRYLRSATLEDVELEEDDLWPLLDARRGTSGDGSGRSRRGTTREVERSMQRENLSWVLERGDERGGRRRGGRGTPSQDEDAALALRLQREEFMGAFRGNDESLDTSSSSSLSFARANLRAMASRAINNNVRNRGRPSFS